MDQAPPNVEAAFVGVVAARHAHGCAEPLGVIIGGCEVLRNRSVWRLRRTHRKRRRKLPTALILRGANCDVASASEPLGFASRV
jgi:hypothetical protein